MDDKKVEQLSKKIYDQTKGTSYAGAADASQGYLQSKGYSAAQIAIARSTPNISNIDAVNEQLSREPKQLPVLHITDGKSWNEYVVEDFVLDGYDPHPPIKAPMAV